MKILHPFFMPINMSRCYAVLWIPTPNHAPIPFKQPLHDGKYTADISDIIGIPFSIKLEVKDKNIDISIQEKDNKDTFEYFITLTFEDFSHNGMVKYSFEPRFNEGGEFGFDERNFPSVVYHLIKGFYHDHDFHEDESDSSLKPYIGDTDIDIHQTDNAAIQHYLLNHAKIVNNIATQAKIFIREAIESKKKDPKNAISDFDAFLKLYIMALGYDAYIHSLYISIYNKRCKISNEREKIFRRCAFNIENSIRYLNVLFKFYDTKLRNNNVSAMLDNAENALILAQQNIESTSESAKSSANWAIAGIVLSLLLGIASILYSIRLSKDSSEELRQTEIMLERTIQKSMERNELKLDSLTELLYTRPKDTINATD